MAETDRERWEARYRAGSHPEREPEPLLAEVIDRAPPAGRALDVACGRGRHAIALARRGYAVEAIDIAPAALAQARERAGGLAIEWRAADLDHFTPERGAYAVVVCVDFTDGTLAPRLPDALEPRGVLLFVARPRACCRFGPPPGAVADWFGALAPLVHRETAERIEFAGVRA